MDEDFKTAWNRFHPTDVPISYEIKYSDRMNGTRFHILQEDRATANNPQELSDLLIRYNTMAAELLGADKPCWMVLPEWLEPAGHPDHIEHANIFDVEEVIDTEEDLKSLTRYQRRQCILSLRHKKLRELFGLTLSLDYYDAANECVYKIYAGLIIWQPGRFDKLLLQIYKDYFIRPLWMNAETGALFAPYHAGIDVAMPTSADLMRLIDKYRDWLPVKGWGYLHLASPEDPISDHSA